MAINLQKGQTINLQKDEFDLSRVTIGLGWDLSMALQKSTPKRGFLSSLLGNDKNPPSPPVGDFDLDASAIILDANEKILERGTSLLGSDVIFFNNLKHRSGHVWHTGDNVTGEGDGDDEQIIIDLEHLSSKYQKIIFLVTIYQGQSKHQHFGLVENAYIRAVDARGKEILKYPLSQAPEYQGMCTMLFGEVYRRDSGWKFRALGQAHPEDGLAASIKKYL